MQPLQNKHRKDGPENKEHETGESFFVRFIKGIERLETLVKGVFRYILLVVGVLLAILLFARLF